MTNGAVLAPAEMEVDGTDIEIAQGTSETDSETRETEREEGTGHVTDTRGHVRENVEVHNHVNDEVRRLETVPMTLNSNNPLLPLAVHTSLLGMILLSHLIP